MSMAIRGVLFDKDGTLIAFRDTWIPTYRRAAADLALLAGEPDLGPRLLRATGYDPDTDELAPSSPLARGTNAEIAALWARQSPTLAALPDLGQRVDARFHEHAGALSQPIVPLDRLFANLRRRGLRLGVATADAELTARATFDRFGVSDQLDAVYGYDSGHAAKPAPDKLLAFARLTGLAPGEIAVVGDAVSDLEMARSGGAGRAIGVLSGVAGRADLAHVADLLLDSVADLESALFPFGNP